MARKHRFESPALRHLYDRYIGDDKARQAVFEDGVANALIARALYDLRIRAGLTQSALAKKIDTTPSVISRLEDSEYEGHSLAMLRRIAAALGRTVEIRFVPRPVPRRKPSPTRSAARTKVRPRSTRRRPGA